MILCMACAQNAGFTSLPHTSVCRFRLLPAWAVSGADSNEGNGKVLLPLAFSASSAGIWYVPKVVCHKMIQVEYMRTSVLCGKRSLFFDRFGGKCQRCFRFGLASFEEVGCLERRLCLAEHVGLRLFQSAMIGRCATEMSLLSV